MSVSPIHQISQRRYPAAETTYIQIAFAKIMNVDVKILLSSKSAVMDNHRSTAARVLSMPQDAIRIA
jgi:hypothetical protein